MVVIRDHNAHHDDPSALPLVTESARVADLTALDGDRTAEVRDAAARILTDVGHGDLVEGDDPPAIEWEGVGSFVDDGDGPIHEKLAHLRDRYEREYPSLLSLRLHEVETPVDFVPGQYVTLEFHRTPRPYSVASSPNREYLEFVVRRVPGGRLTADLFADLDEGDEVTVRGPNGDFVMAEPSGRDLAFLATGTGVAPLKSMIEYTFESGRDEYEGEPRDIWLFLGASWADDLASRERFRELAADHDHFHFVPTLSRESYLTDWDGETDYVQQTFVKYLAADADVDLSGPLAEARTDDPATDVDARIDPTDLEVYACGVTAMVQTLVDVAQSVGVPDERIRGEGYG